MKEIFFNTFSKKAEKIALLKKMINHYFSENLIDKYFVDKKLVIWLAKAPNKNIDSRNFYYYSHNSLFDLSNMEALIVDKNKDFKWESKINNQDYRYRNSSIKSTVFEIKKDNVIDVLNMWSQDQSNYAQIELNIDFLKSIWEFSNKDLTLNVLNHLNVIASDEQVKRYIELSTERKKDLNLYILGFLGAIALDREKSIKIENLIYTIFINLNKYCSYSNLIVFGSEIIEELHNFNRLMFSMFIDTYRNDEKIKYLPYYINWDYEDTENVGSLYDIFNEEIESRNFTAKEKEKILKKMFSLHPQISMLLNINGVDNYFLTMKDFNKEYFIKRLSDFFKTRLEIENKQSNMMLFECLMTDDEINENKELFKNIFPVFYKEEVSFKNFIEIKEKEIKYAEFKIKDLMDLFPLNQSNERVLEQYTSFVLNILKNYEVDVFINNKKEEIVEKKKKREVVSLMQLYLSGNNLDFLSNEFIQKMLRMIHDKIQDKFYYGEEIDAVAREIYLKLSLSDKDSVLKSKGKI